MKKMRALEAMLWTVLAGSAGYGVFCFFEAEGTVFSAPIPPQQTSAETDGPIVGRMAGSGYKSGGSQADGSVTGKISIPALNLSVPIVEGLTRQDLLRGVGHVSGSAIAGGLGNMALAAHRDTFFRPLRNVKADMDVYVSSSTGTYNYKIDRTEIVSPEQVNILEIGSVPQLTLITCYPFNYIGAAPQRFIVHAHLTSLLPLNLNTARP